MGGGGWYEGGGVGCGGGGERAASGSMVESVIQATLHDSSRLGAGGT